MFICPKCNIEVADPEYIPAPPWWRRPRGSSGKPIPVCPSGHKLRRQILGNLTELSLPLAFLRGLWFCGIAMALGMLEDLRRVRNAPQHLGLTVMTGTGLVIGMFAFSYAWSWAGRNGPVHRLTSLALGIALGSFVPALVACHALYFHWVNSVQTACGQGLVSLYDFALTRHWLS